MESRERGNTLKILMLGWEFPPFISGGLGTACYGLTKALDEIGVEVTFVLPAAVDNRYTNHVKLLSPDSEKSLTGTRDKTLANVKFRTIDSPLQPYTSPERYQEMIQQIIRRKQTTRRTYKPGTAIGGINYKGDLYCEVHRYASVAVELAREEQFDVIHAHDWMTYPAGIAVAAVTGKPLVVHLHSSEFDRSGEQVNQMVYDIEREGMEKADKVIAVSYLTRSIVISRYGIRGDKVEVVHNGIQRYKGVNKKLAEVGIDKDEKIVLFLGRITMQKGPEYFLAAAKKVLEVTDNVKFVIAGTGDMMQRIVEMAAQLGIGQKVLFTGFLRGDDVQTIYRMADLFVMPSVSEPFGIVPLEALDNDVPVIISKQSGVSEILMHALKVDFWDVDEIANKIVAVLKYPPLQSTLRSYGNYEVRRLSWKDTARKCSRIYENLISCVV